MPENKNSLPNPTTPATIDGAGVNQEDYEKIINDPRFEEIINDCMMKCISEHCNEVNIDCEKKCFFKVCFRVAWVLYHAWYVDSSPTAVA